MKKNIVIFLSVWAVIGLMGCALEIEQPVGIPVASTSTPEASSDSNSTLDGRLVYSTFSTENDIPSTQIKILELVTGEIKTTYNVIGNAWIYYLAISPDEKNLLISYTPPFEQGAESYTSLYTAPLDQPDAMQLLFTPPTPSDRYTQAEWSPDGKYIYFVHYNFWNRAKAEIFPHYEIYRMAYPIGEPEKIVDQGFWPRLSPDGSKLVYVALDAVTGLNRLFAANADGSDPQEIVLTGLAAADVLDAPVFTPDGKSILFSAPVAAQSYTPNWLDILTGVQVALAHNVPSDWWSVPVEGGAVTRLTYLQTVRLFGSISPDGQHIASLSGDGIFVMDLDGSNLTSALADQTVSSALIWIP